MDGVYEDFMGFSVGQDDSETYSCTVNHKMVFISVHFELVRVLISILFLQIISALQFMSYILFTFISFSAAKPLIRLI